MREVDRRFESVKFIPALFFFFLFLAAKKIMREENCKEIVNICREY